ncbi:thiamine pyrophosphate-dependent enzyme [Nitrosopumilus maritimus]|uniref:thiamine pyrophosphate-dependent enzyme n=1 Tax=Nitrosopumilus maritimus TaxID=338192 RepID=UPI000159B165|nr:thiamine pyrophosphate-dependent enzyme [Nitrosopumilus maritimus]
MIRKEAVATIARNIKNSPIVSANGFMSRDLFEVCDKESNFYMIGSMGLASSIGLGLAIKNPKKRVFVFDGDGNILMNLGSIVTIGSMKPKNLIHVVFDNSSHESTGGQPTNSSKIHLEKIAKIGNYTTFTAKSKNQLESMLKKIKRLNGPIFLLVKISTSKERSKRVIWKPKDIRDRVKKSL